MSSKDSDEPIQRDPISRSSGGAVPQESPQDEEGTTTPDNVGESVSRRGEEIGDADGKEAGRKDLGTEGEAQRPAGTSDSRDATSVDPDDS